MLVLHAEDDEVARSLFQAVTHQDPRIDLYVVENGRKAWEVLQRGLNPDLCVFDINMPEMSGVEVVKRMRRDGGFEHTHVMLLTAANDKETILDAVYSNITHYMIKPVDPLELIKKLNSFLEYLPPPLDVSWLAEPRNYIRRNFISVEKYKAMFETFFEDLDLIMTLLIRRMDGSNVPLLLSCVNKINDISIHIGASSLPEVCAKARTLLSSQRAEDHQNGVKLLDAEMRKMLATKSKVLRHLQDLRDRDILE